MSGTRVNATWLRAFPTILSATRILLAPFIFCAILDYRLDRTFLLLLLAGATDVLDGYLARRLGAETIPGAYLDVTADFAVILASISALVVLGAYPVWLVALVVVMFVQFLLSSRAGRPVYDPVGKYYGTVLFVAVLLTVGMPDLALLYGTLAGVVVLTAASLASRVFALRFAGGGSEPGGRS